MTPVRLLVGLALFLAVAAAPRLVQSYPTGAPPESAGDPGSGFGAGACTACHGGNAVNSGTGGVTIDAPAQVRPGETVTITVAVDNTTPVADGATPRQGFEAVVKDAGTGDFVGTVAPVGATTRFATGSTRYITQTASGSVVTSWSFDWTAPASGAPATVTVYAAGNAADGIGSSGDYIYTASRTVAIVGGTDAEPAPTPTLAVGSVWPNPARTVATLPIDVATPTAVRVRIVDGLGRTVREATDGALGAGRQQVALDLAGLPAGLYFAVVETPEGRQTRPLTVAR